MSSRHTEIKEYDYIIECVADVFSETFCHYMYEKAKELFNSPGNTKKSITDCYKDISANVTKIRQSNSSAVTKINTDLLNNLATRLNKRIPLVHNASDAARFVAMVLMPQEYHSQLRNEMIVKINNRLLNELFLKCIKFIYSEEFYFLKEIIDNTDRREVYTTFKIFVKETVEQQRAIFWSDVNKSDNSGRDNTRGLHEKNKELAAELHTATTQGNELKNQLSITTASMKTLFEQVKKLKATNQIINQELTALRALSYKTTPTTATHAIEESARNPSHRRSTVRPPSPPRVQPSRLSPPPSRPSPPPSLRLPPARLSPPRLASPSHMNSATYVSIPALEIEKESDSMFDDLDFYDV